MYTRGLIDTFVLGRTKMDLVDILIWGNSAGLECLLFKNKFKTNYSFWFGSGSRRFGCNSKQTNKQILSRKGWNNR